jgi:hypothetical protein
MPNCEAGLKMDGARMLILLLLVSPRPSREGGEGCSVVKLLETKTSRRETPNGDDKKKGEKGDLRRGLEKGDLRWETSGDHEKEGEKGDTGWTQVLPREGWAHAAREAPAPSRCSVAGLHSVPRGGSPSGSAWRVSIRCRVAGLRPVPLMSIQ